MPRSCRSCRSWRWLRPVSDLRADEPAAVACGRALQPVRNRVVGDLARALVVDAAAVERKIQILRDPVEAPVSAAEHVSGVDRLHVELDRLAARASADECAKPQIAAERAIDAHALFRNWCWSAKY